MKVRQAEKENKSEIVGKEKLKLIGRKVHKNEIDMRKKHE